MMAHGQKIIDGCLPVLKAHRNLRQELDRLKRANLNNRAAQDFYQDLIAELEQLVPASFIRLYDMQRMAHLERYIKSMEIRAQRAVVDFEKDRVKAEEVKTFSARLDQLVKTLSPDATDDKRNALEDLFWLIQEYKVSVYAQELKTAIPVSKKRLEQKIDQIQRMI